MAKDCPKGFAVCFHCNQTGHRKESVYSYEGQPMELLKDMSLLLFEL